MLDLDELFKKRPFIYLINNEYYAFGTGVCALCNKKVNYVTLPVRYDRYMEALKNSDINQNEAWKVYRKLVFVAENVQKDEEHLNLKKQFDSLGFSEEEKDEIKKQLDNMVSFFRSNKLVDYYR